MDNAKIDAQPARARQEDLVIQELPDEVLVYDLKKHKAHCLNQTAAFVWHHCDGRTTPTELALLMEKEFDKPITEDEIWLALRQLSKADLLQERVVRPGDRLATSRRQALRRLGIAAMVPLVVSIVSPTALASPSSPPATCAACSKKTAAGCGVCAGFNGTCYKNAGCGAGNAIKCDECVNCFTDPNAKAWEAPGTIC